MTEFSGFVWLLLAVATAGGIVGLLNYLASSVRNQRIVHELRIEVVSLQSSYLRKLRALKTLSERGGDGEIKLKKRA